NARLPGPISPDDHGVCLRRHHTDVTDCKNKYGADSAYAAQVAQVAMRLSGADVVVPRGGMMRTSGPTSTNVQPHAAEAHVDFTQSCAERRAETLYRNAHPQGAG